MAEDNQPKKYSVEEIRKTHPRMGMRWDKEEDERLQAAYREFRSEQGRDFEPFLDTLVKDFGRAAGGLKARLAMHFDDVPGWDYEQSKYRTEGLEKEVESLFTPEKDTLLKSEYEKYVATKVETYLAFVKRMNETLGGVENKYIRHRLEKLVGTIEMYKRSDLIAQKPKRASSLEEPLENIDFSGNPESEEALRIMDETNENLFLTGEAGTGKSTLLQYFRSITKKNVVVLAPTGVAALNVGGQTIHSFCGFGPDITLQKVKRLGGWAPKKKLLQKVHTIVIDEISMVRADLLDCVDKFLRLNGPVGHESFGGVQMVFIGDLFQLPPVEKDFQQLRHQYTNGHTNDANNTSLFDGVDADPDSGHLGANSSDSGRLYQSPYFFDSQVFRTTNFRHVSLKHMYRQHDPVFIDVLNAVRNNRVSQNHLTVLNSRAQAQGTKFTFEQFAIYLTPTNARARQVNNFFLEKIPSPLKTYKGAARGTFENKELPTDLDLQIKIGSQVMMLNNDQRKRWVNGTMGKIIGIEKAGGPSPFKTGASPSFPPQALGRGRGEVDFAASERPRSIDEVSEPDPFSYEYIDEDLPPMGMPASSAESVVIELETGDTVYVQPHTWEMFKFVLDGSTQSLDSEVTGSFTQYPFKLAWAVTIHKAQGKTFNKVYVDLATGTFAHGQLYVALSRCRTLEGLYLKDPIMQKDIILDNRVVEFMKSFRT